MDHHRQHPPAQLGTPGGPSRQLAIYRPWRGQLWPMLRAQRYWQRLSREVESVSVSRTGAGTVGSVWGIRHCLVVWRFRGPAVVIRPRSIVRVYPVHQVPGWARLHPRPKQGGLVDRSYVCIIWIRLPQVSSKTAIVTLANSVGPIVKATPSDFSFSNSARMSVTPKDAAGMPWSNIPF